ncbi:MAG: MBL fold metallo-hydrolase [Actinobacteria bacterium]|nr:MBL fold metallo-hydrolase [Actinomycetota bacterium]
MLFSDMKPSAIHAYRPETHMWPAPANSFLLTDRDGAILIDAGCGSPDTYEKLRTFIRNHGFNVADVHTLVLSHAHPDHMGAVPFILEEADPRIYIHKLEKPLARDPQLLNRSFDMSLITRYYKERLGDTDPDSINIIDYFKGLCPMGSAEATDTVREGDVLPLGGRRLRVLHTPGHAPGHISLYDDENRVLLSGDIIGKVVAWYCPSGGGARGYLESLEKAESLDVDVVMPSHGEDITDVAGAIAHTRDVILSRERLVVRALSGGSMSLLQLTNLLFPREHLRMFPGIQIAMSHLIKLQGEERIECTDWGNCPLFSLKRDM